jgi:oligopeptide/dipeptide ABC transporter ATP-binding protein
VSALLSVHDLQVDFATQRGLLQAVRGVDLAMDKGEILGVVGESGSGKSVTAQALLRLLPANGRIKTGTIRFDGESVLEMTPRELGAYRGGKVSMVFQEPGRSFDPIYSIGGALAETLLAHEPGLSKEEVRERSVRLLREVHVPYAEERLGNYPHQFSGGLLQRIMIAVALAPGPEVLIADEPTTALDVTIQAQIMDLLLELQRKRNLAILFISHNLALIASVADRIVVMYGGLVMETGPSTQVLQEPRHPYTRALLDALLMPEEHYSRHPLRVVPGTTPDPHTPEPGCPFAPRCRLAGSECRLVVPPLQDESAGSHRCVRPGVKEARRA